ncbi:MAG TPA: WbqC family protein [Saprospiraceae bacterium]|nr:WbqC family protein [Saprospiraceae bacterium]
MIKGDQNTSCLVELHYLPCIQYLSLFFKYEQVRIEKYEHYQKGSYRNRCYIASAQGREMLSVPLLKGKNQQQLIQDVGIAYHTPWHAQHWNAMQTAYGKAPFFIHYADDLHDILISHYEKLYDLNRTILKWLLRKTHAPAQLMESSGYAEASVEGSVDYRNTILPETEFQSPAYNQVFMDRLGFIANLSALDVLMNLGPEAYTYLETLLAVGR